ncbi:hypothetical protein L218DRAFT_963859 [Marasmius fiardii PR-910]|nr:hypothetical protein L218DRAFT_963859 [Marasmius fiardii PR-910]
MATVSPDAKFLVLFGSNAMLNIVNLVVAGMFYGVYVVLFCVALYILCRREGNFKARFGLLFAVVSLFTLSSFWFWSNVDLLMSIIKTDLVDNVGQPLASKHMAYVAKSGKLSSVAQVIIPIMIIIGDTIVFWRAWVLCDVNRKIVTVPLVFLLGTTVCSFAFLGCYAQNDWPVSAPDTCNKLQISAFSLSIVTNITGTLVIGYRFWLYRQAVGKYLGQCRYRTRIEKVLFVLLETGAVYSVIWIVELVLVLMPPSPDFAGKVVHSIFVASCIQLVGIYPTLLVVLVYMECSLWDSSEVSKSTTFSTTLPTSSTGSAAPTPEDFKSNSTLVGKPLWV